jgi:hypothetical protein
MATSVFETSWKKVIGSFRSSQGHLLYPIAKQQLYDYVVHGQAPEGPIRAMLEGRLSDAFRSVTAKGEAERLHAVWEFIRYKLPTSIWRSPFAVQKYPFIVQTREGLQRQYEHALRIRLKKDGAAPLQLD